MSQDSPIVAVEEVRIVTVLEQRGVVTEISLLGAQGAKGDTGATGATGAPGAPGGDSTFTKVAGEAISAYRAVIGSDATDVLLASNTDVAHRNRVLGITENAAGLGGSVTVRRIGPITNAGWAWTPYAPIFVGTGGTLTQTPPVAPAVFSQVIAVALSATVIYVWPRDVVSIV